MSTDDEPEAPASPAQHFDHLDPAVAPGIHAILADLRRACPVAHSDAYGGFYVVTKHDDLLEVGQDHKRFSAACDGLGAVMLLPEFAGVKAILFELDPPEQTGWRRLLQRFFNTADVAHHEPYIREVTRAVIEPLRQRSTADFVADLAVQIPPIIIAAMLGVPEAQRPVLSELARAYFGAGSLAPEEAQLAAARYAEFLQELVRGRRGVQATDLFSTVVNTEMNGRLPTDAELQKFAFLMIAAGHLTTTDTIANTLLVLADDLALQRRVRAEPALIPALIEESVRYESAVAATGRTVRTDTTLHGVALAAGDRLLLTWGSGARDEARYDDPDAFMIERAQPVRHIGWGAGVHRCLGMQLARLELRVVIEEVLRALPEFRIAPGATIERTYGVIRGVKAAPVVWTI
jgi:cytochrome P450